MLDNLLSEGFIKPLHLIWTLLITLVLTFAAGVLVSTASGLVRNIGLYIVFVPLPFALGFLFYGSSIWFPVMIGEIAVVLTLAGGGLLNYATEGKQKKYIKGAFGQYLSPQVIEELIANPDRLGRSMGHDVEVVLYFSANWCQTTINREAIIGPIINPIRPNQAIPPKIAINTINGCSPLLPPSSFGLMMF